MSLVSKSQFIGGDDRAYLYTAADGLMPRSALDATARYYDHKSQAALGRGPQDEVVLECRTGLATLMGAQPADIALLGSASEGINAVYNLIDWQPGDNIVLPVDDLEFPSVVLPAIKRKDAGIEVRRVSHEHWEIEPEWILDRMDERTRLVLVSHVSYRTGYRFDLERVSELVRRRNPHALLVVDATQSLGVIPVPSHACDFLVATSCKWLLGPHGIGVFYWNRAQVPDVVPASIGWFSVVDDLQFPYELKPDAGRFELGGPNMPAIYALNEGVKMLLNVGLERIAEHALTLAGTMRDGLQDLGLRIMTPSTPERRAGIVAWEDPDFRTTAARLAEHDVIVTGSAGRIRAGVHLYNDASEVRRLIDAMSRI